jgi:integrase
MVDRWPQGRLRWPTQEEITRLLETASKSRNRELRAAVILALNTGLRLGELIGLTWERVDPSRGVIRQPGAEEQRPSVQDPLHQDRLQQRRRGRPA